MTAATAELVLYGNPGLSPIDSRSYLSDDWSVLVNGEAATVLRFERATQHPSENYWDPGDDLGVSWLKFSLTGLAVTLTIEPPDDVVAEIGTLQTHHVHITPARSFALMGGQIFINDVREHDRIRVIVGDQSNGGTLAPLCIQVASPLPDLTGTVIEYEDETLVETGTTLHLTGPATYDIGIIEMEVGSRLRIDGDVVAVGRVTSKGAGSILIDGHGVISGEHITTEEVQALPSFDAMYVYSTIRTPADPPAYTIPDNTVVNGITIVASPFYAIVQPSTVDGVMILSPWCSNTDGIHLCGGSQLNQAAAERCFIWTGDDAIFLGEDTGAYRPVRDILVSSSYSAAIHFGYRPALEYDLDLSLLSNIDLVSGGGYVDYGQGKRVGHGIVAWCDGTTTSQVINKYTLDGIRFWADPSGEIRVKPIELEHHRYPWGVAFMADCEGNIEDITFRDVWFEVVPVHKSRLIGRDASNGLRRLRLEGVRYGGAPASGGTYLANANFDTYFETNRFARWRIDNEGFVMTLNDTRLPQLPTAGTVTDDDDFPVFQDGPPQRRLSWAALKAKLEADGFLVTEGIDGDVSGFVGGVGILREVIPATAFTPTGATTAEYEMAGAVPAGARLIGCWVTVTVGFAEDVSCTLTIGTGGGDVDRYHTGALDIFTAAPDGIQTGVPSGALNVLTAESPTLTITTAAQVDAVCVGLGSITVDILYARRV